jgi:hypothetical protein
MPCIRDQLTVEPGWMAGACQETGLSEAAGCREGSVGAC